MHSAASLRSEEVKLIHLQNQIQKDFFIDLIPNPKELIPRIKARNIQMNASITSGIIDRSHDKVDL